MWGHLRAPTGTMGSSLGSSQSRAGSLAAPGGPAKAPFCPLEVSGPSRCQVWAESAPRTQPWALGHCRGTGSSDPASQGRLPRSPRSALSRPPSAKGQLQPSETLRMSTVTGPQTLWRGQSSDRERRESGGQDRNRKLFGCGAGLHGSASSGTSPTDGLRTASWCFTAGVLIKLYL